jgi:hypothetical protein
MSSKQNKANSPKFKPGEVMGRYMILADQDDKVVVTRLSLDGQCHFTPVSFQNGITIGVTNVAVVPRERLFAWLGIE